jgi:predicted nuclease of predicted toxin-antitoxin system
MTARSTRSKRRSATTSPPESGRGAGDGDEQKLVWFVDRSLGKRVCDALRAAGADVVYLEDEHSDDASDADWLADVGARGYVVITKDKQIRLNLTEREALLRANVRAFFLTSGNLTGAEMAEILTTQLPRMTKLARATAPPFLATVTRTEVRLLEQSRRR